MKAQIIFLLLTSCQIGLSCEPDSKEISWQRIELPEKGTVYSMYGDINNELIVGVTNEILKSKDMGHTWTSVKKTSYSINHFLNKGDTLIGITNFDNYYSVDNGETWLDYKSKIIRKDTPSYLIYVNQDISIKLVRSYEGECEQPSQVIIKGKNSAKNIFPYNYPIQTLYSDEQDRIYLGTTNYSWNKTTKCFDVTSPNKALIFIGTL